MFTTNELGNLKQQMLSGTPDNINLAFAMLECHPDINMEEIIKYEPMMQNRFFVSFPEELRINPFMVHKVEGVECKCTPELEYNPIKITFYGSINDSISDFFIKLMYSKDYNFQTAIQNIKIQMLDPTGMVVSEMLIGIDHIVAIHFGDLDYSKDELLKPSITLMPNNIIINNFT